MSQFIYMEITVLEQNHNRGLKKEDSGTQEFLLGMFLGSWTCQCEGILWDCVLHLEEVKEAIGRSANTRTLASFPDHLAFSHLALISKPHLEQSKALYCFSVILLLIIKAPEIEDEHTPSIKT